MKRKSGYYEKLGNLDYFTPLPLPPTAPSLEFNSEIIELFGNTMNQLGKLNEMVIPNLAQFLKSYIIKEAILSSEIEGINTTITEIFTQPIIGEKVSKETQLIINYTDALEEALKMIQQDKMPISNRVILKAHEILMSGGEGTKSSPGQYRNNQ